MTHLSRTDHLLNFRINGTFESMSSLEYRKRRLFFARRSVESLAKKYGTPLYLYDLRILGSRYREMFHAFFGEADIHFAMKSNHCPQVLRFLKREGAGIDTVSLGEVKWGLKHGFKPSDIILSGVGKSSEEIEFAIRKRIKLLNVESPAELERVGTISKRLKLKASVGFRFNPDVNAKTHPYISTGFSENKFGMGREFLPEVRMILRKHPQIQLQGVSLHIGSQIQNPKVFFEAIRKTRPVYESFLSEGHPMRYFDVGGGLGIDYHDGSGAPPSVEEYAGGVLQELSGCPARILLEPGRWLVGPCGVLVVRVEYIKTNGKKRFVIVDGGMNHLLRPALYGADHRVLAAHQSKSLPVRTDVVGPICESSDFLAQDRKLPNLEEGDVLVVGEAGAYGMTMASAYNLRDLPKEVALK